MRSPQPTKFIQRVSFPITRLLHWIFPCLRVPWQRTLIVFALLVALFCSFVFLFRQSRFIRFPAFEFLSVQFRGSVPELSEIDLPIHPDIYEPRNVVLLRRTWRERGSLCVMIVATSWLDCVTWIEANGEDGVLAWCLLDDSDTWDENSPCETLSDIGPNGALLCLRLQGREYSYEDLPAKVMDGFAQMSVVQSRCRWVFKVDSDIRLTKPLSKVVALPQVSSCVDSCYVGTIVRGWRQDPNPTSKFHDASWTEQMGTDGLPPYAWGGCYGISADLLPVFSWLFATGYYVSRGLEDVWRGVTLSTLGATFCPIGKFWIH